MILRHILVKHEHEARDLERKLDEAAAQNKVKIDIAAEILAASAPPPDSIPEKPSRRSDKTPPPVTVTSAELAEFAALAQKFSSCSSREVGGSLGDLTGKMNRLNDEFREAAEKLKPGERSGPVRTPFGYHLILRER